MIIGNIRTEPLKPKDMTTIEKQIESSQLDDETLSYVADKPEDRDEIEMKNAVTKMLRAIQDKEDFPPPPKGLILRTEICKAFSIPVELIFTHTRKREVVNARQVYVYLLTTTDVANKRIIPFDGIKFRKIDPGMGSRDRPTHIARHTGFNHSTLYNSCKTTWDYYETEPFYKSLIDRLQACLLGGIAVMPDISIPVV